MLLTRSRAMWRSTVAGSMLALLIVSTVALPLGDVARGWAATPTDSQAAISQHASLPPILSNLSMTPYEMPTRLDGSSSVAFATLSLRSVAGLNWKGVTLSARSKSARSLFSTGPLFDNPANGQQSNEKTHLKTKQGVRKKYLALGILGALGAAGGVVAVAGSNTVCTTNNIGSNTQAKSICNSVHTAGEVMIPAGAGVAVVGFYLAFRNRH